MQAWIRWALWWHYKSCVSAQSEGAIKEILKGAHVVPDIGVDAIIDAELEEMEQDECSAEQWRCNDDVELALLEIILLSSMLRPGDSALHI